MKCIPDEKQKPVINAAISTFAAKGYRKASMNDIALSAGISKSMVFHYFGSKRELYLFLLEYCGERLAKAMDCVQGSCVADFFDTIMDAAKAKLLLMKEYPSILFFLSSAFNERDTEVEKEVKELVAKNMRLSGHFVLESTDAEKFKPGIDISLVFKILMYFTEGYLSRAPVKNSSDIGCMIDELDACMNLMRNNFYKETCI